MASKSEVRPARRIRVSFILALAAVGSGALAGSIEELTPEAVTAVEALFPQASVLGVGRERESGVEYFEVAIREGGQKIEIEVTADGAVGEVEQVIPLADVSDAARAEIARITGGARVKQVERHEIHGVARDGQFVPVEPPVVGYEIQYKADGEWREMIVRDDGVLISPREAGDDDEEDETDDAVAEVG